MTPARKLASVGLTPASLASGIKSHAFRRTLISAGASPAEAARLERVCTALRDYVGSKGRVDCFASAQLSEAIEGLGLVEPKRAS